MTVSERSLDLTGGKLPYGLTDADEHSTPRFGAYADYIDPDKKHLAITMKPGKDGRPEIRYLGTEWGFSHENRLFTPPVISTVDAEAALKELDAVMNDPNGAPKVIQLVAGPSIHKSPFRPEMDPFWARLNEAHIKVCTHLSTVTFYGRQGLEWSEDEVILGDMNALQWVLYYGDRPAYETVVAAILQGLFNRFPNVQLLLSEQGTVWVPYIARKMDHAFLMGRKATWR